MKFLQYITEFSKGQAGSGITFVDIDETAFRTFAKIIVKKDGKTVRELDNQEFNSYKLKPGEEYDFWQFRSADIFKKTSIPIPQTVNRIKKMIAQIEAGNKDSKIVFLTARVDFDDKKTFLSKFEEHGIKMSDKSKVYVERTGNLASGSIEERKKRVMLDYIKTGLYRRVRLIDDHAPNLHALIEIEKELSPSIKQKVIDTYGLDVTKEKLPVISFYALHVQPDGSLKKIN